MREDQHSPNYTLILSVFRYKYRWKHDHIRIPKSITMGKRKIEGSCEPNKIVKLSSFGFTTSKALQTVNCSETSENSTPCPSKKHGKFLESWKINRPWLRYDSKQNLMFCDICIQAQVTNVFTTGCDMFKKEAVTKHEKRTGIDILFNEIWMKCKFTCSFTVKHFYGEFIF